MITWYFGQTGSGKTTTAMKQECDILLDGDDMRNTISEDLGYGIADRMKQHMRVAKLARLLNMQVDRVVVATIMPTYAIRERVRMVLNHCIVEYVYCEGGKGVDAEHPFDTPLLTEYSRKVARINTPAL